MQIKKITIEGFHNIVRKEYDFEKLNYLYGKNGAGKSSVLEAIQLGLLGYVPGTNKTKQGVFGHSNNHTMAVSLVLDDNGAPVNIQRIWTNKGKSVSEYTTVSEGYDLESIIAELELPLFNFDEFTHMTANSLKDWFINYLPKKSFTTKWKQVLNEALTDAGISDSSIDPILIKESVEAIEGFNADGIEEIRQANAYFKNQLSFMKAELQRKMGTIQSLIHYDDYDASLTEEELAASMKSLEEQIVSASVAKQKKDHLQVIKVQMDKVKDSVDSIDRARTNLDDLKHQRQILQDIQTEQQEEYRRGHYELSNYDRIINSNGKCVYTGELCDDILNLREEYIQKKNELTERRSKLGEKINQREEEIVLLNSKVLAAEMVVSQCEHDVKMYQSLKADFDSYEPVDDVIFDVESLKQSLDRLREDYGKAVANRKYNELSDVVLKDKYRIETTIECLKAWDKLTGVNGLQAQSTYNPFDDLSDVINVWIKQLFGPEASGKFISDGKANSFSFGVERNGTYVPYALLSSGEKCLFVVSMYLSLIYYSRSPLKLILMDDFLDHLDNNNFEKFLNMVSSIADMQYIFAGVNPVPIHGCNVIKVE